MNPELCSPRNQLPPHRFSYSYAEKGEKECPISFLRQFPSVCIRIRSICITWVIQKSLCLEMGGWSMSEAGRVAHPFPETCPTGGIESGGHPPSRKKPEKGGEPAHPAALKSPRIWVPRILYEDDHGT